MKRITDLLKTAAWYWRFATSAILILIVLIISLIYLSAYMRGETSTDVSGRAHIDFRVFYMENEIYDENPIPQNLHFLMSFTDYIEMDARFNISFEEDFQVYYEYTAVEHFVIRYMATGDANLNPIVYEEHRVLSETRGNVTTQHLSFNSNANAGGSYTIYPRPHIDTYLEFVAAQARQMYQENIIARGIRGFSAELFVNFAFTVRVPELGYVRTLNHGYRISLTTEVYNLIVTGYPSFTDTLQLTAVNLPFRMTFPVVVLLVGIVAIAVYIFCYSIKQLKADPNERKQKAITILKRYANEIVVRDVPLNLGRYEIYRVDAFEELLKLAINLNKHIVCYHDERLAEFAVIVDAYAYYFAVHYNDTDSGFDDATLVSTSEVEVVLVEAERTAVED